MTMGSLTRETSKEGYAHPMPLLPLPQGVQHGHRPNDAGDRAQDQGPKTIPSSPGKPEEDDCFGRFRF